MTISLWAPTVASGEPEEKPPIDIIPGHPAEDWRPLPAYLEEAPGGTLSRRRMRSWSLVLEARRIDQQAGHFGNWSGSSMASAEA